MTSAQQPSNNELPLSSFDLSGIKVLVVEDDPGTREFVAFVLQQYKADVTATASADQALEALAKTLPDLLVIDIGMPQMDGYTLIRKIRSLPPQAGLIPAVALTAFVGEQHRRQALAAGFQIHLPKPIEPAELVAVVAQLTNKE